VVTPWPPVCRLASFRVDFSGPAKAIKKPEKASGTAHPHGRAVADMKPKTFLFIAYEVS